MSNFRMVTHQLLFIRPLRLVPQYRPAVFSYSGEDTISGVMLFIVARILYSIG